MSLDRYHVLQQQIAAALETVPGTLESLVLGDVKLRPFTDISFATEFARALNDQVADDLGQARDYVVGKGGRIGFQAELKTSGDLSTAPAIARYLQACGCKLEQIMTATIGAPSGGDNAFAEGETYSATGGKTGTIDSTISAGGTLRYRPATGGALVDSDVVTVGSDSATVSGASSDAGWRISPTSTSHKTLTMMRAVKYLAGTAAKDRVMKIKGAMGSAVLTFEAQKVPVFRGDFLGVLHSIGLGDLFAGPTYEASLPPYFLNSAVQLDGKTVHIESFQLDLGVQTFLDPDPSTNGGTSGYSQVEVLRREPKLTINPYDHDETTGFDAWGFAQSGTPFACLFTVGTSPNQISIKIPKGQIREDSLAARNDREAHGLTIYATRDTTLLDNEWAMYFQ